MTFNKWTKKKPKFNKPCLLITADLLGGIWRYNSWTVEKINLQDEWCFVIVDSGGYEWDDINTFEAGKYYCMPLLKNKP